MKRLESRGARTVVVLFFAALVITSVVIAGVNAPEQSSTFGPGQRAAGGAKPEPRDATYSELVP